jgi:hypothetical protein
MSPPLATNYEVRLLHPIEPAITWQLITRLASLPGSLVHGTLTADKMFGSRYLPALLIKLPVIHTSGLRFRRALLFEAAE